MYLGVNKLQDTNIISEILVIEYVIDGANMRVLGFLFEPVRERGTISYLEDIL